ncbi:hypothetical protein DFJ74DRAFT_705605 [Hyaloraphidium curvatum]|nr:hypothetical protein DFJ74DRAFT_705605 [Hyaloraphidium curvatum]
MEPTKATVAEPVFPPEILYRIAEFLPHRRQSEFARASRGALALLTPLAFSRFVHMRSFAVSLLDRMEDWRRRGWLACVKSVRTDCGARTAEGVDVVKRLLAELQDLRSASLDFEDEAALRAVLRAVPRSVTQLEVLDRGSWRNDSQPFEFPALRTLAYRGEKLGAMSRVLADIIAHSDELEDLEVSLDGSNHHGLFFAGAKMVRCRVTTWHLLDDATFAFLCGTPDFRPRRIIKTDGARIGKKSFEAISKLPSVTSLRFSELASHMLVTISMPPSLQDLTVDRLLPTLFRVPHGDDLVDLLVPNDAGIRITIGELCKPRGLCPYDVEVLRAEVAAWMGELGVVRVTPELAEVLAPGAADLMPDEPEEGAESEDGESDVGFGGDDLDGDGVRFGVEPDADLFDDEDGEEDLLYYEDSDDDFADL